LPEDFEAQIKVAALPVVYADELRPIAYVAEAIEAIGLPRCVAIQRHAGKNFTMA